MKNQLKIAKSIMSIFKVEYVSLPIANTSKGLLSTVLRKDEEELHFTLDAVPVSEEQTKQLLSLMKDNENI